MQLGVLGCGLATILVGVFFFLAMKYGDEEEFEAKKMALITRCIYLSFSTVPAAAMFAILCYTVNVNCKPWPHPRTRRPPIGASTNSLSRADSISRGFQEKLEHRCKWTDRDAKMLPACML